MEAYFARTVRPNADDREVPANWTPPWQVVQWDHPGSVLSFASGSAIKRITAGVKAAADRSLRKFRSAGRAFTLRQSQFRTKKEYCFALAPASPSLGTLAGLKRQHVQAANLTGADNCRPQKAHDLQTKRNAKGTARLITTSVASDYRIGRVSLQLVDISYGRYRIARRHLCHSRWCWNLHSYVKALDDGVVGAADFRYQGYPGSALRDSRAVGLGRRGSWIVAVVCDHVVLD